jgi:hypothetical protein
MASKRDELQKIIDRLREDHRMYQSMLGSVMKRMADIEGSDPEHHRRFIDWAPNAVLYNALIICESQVRGQIEDLTVHLEDRNAQIVRLVESEDDT